MSLGADTEGLRRAAEQFISGGDRLADIARSLSRLTSTVAWTRTDRDRFAQESAGICDQLAGVAEEIARRARELQGHAEEQDRASGPDDGSDMWSQLVGAAGSLRGAIGPMVASFRSGHPPPAAGGDMGLSVPGVVGLSPFGGDFEEPDQVSDFDVPSSREIDAVNRSIANGLEGWKATDIDQAGLGDCWFIASAGSIGAAHPEIIQQNMSWDAGTLSWTVTLHDRGGNPHDYTVSADSLIDEGVRGPDGRITWLTVYEAAAAQHMGSYAETENNLASLGFRMVTGESADTHLTDPSSDDIEARLANGEAVVASTWDGPGWFGGVEDDRIVGNHVYVVDEVLHPGDSGYPEEATGPQIKVINPWGAGNEDKPHELYLSESEFSENFMSVDTWRHGTRILAPGPPYQVPNTTYA